MEYDTLINSPKALVNDNIIHKLESVCGSCYKAIGQKLRQWRRTIWAANDFRKDTKTIIKKYVKELTKSQMGEILFEGNLHNNW